MRRYLLASMVSAAESLRSTCDSERSAPECSRQRFPAATPHLGQGTEESCSLVRSRILTQLGCDKTYGKAVRFGTVAGESGNVRDSRQDLTSYKAIPSACDYPTRIATHEIEASKPKLTLSRAAMRIALYRCRLPPFVGWSCVSGKRRGSRRWRRATLNLRRLRRRAWRLAGP